MTHLRLVWDSELHLTAPLHHLTALRRLCLGGGPVRLSRTASLPPSLSKLDLGCNLEPPSSVLPLPTQVCVYGWTALRRRHAVCCVELVC